MKCLTSGHQLFQDHETLFLKKYFERRESRPGVQAILCGDLPEIV